MKTFMKEFESIGHDYALQLKKKINIQTVDDFDDYSLTEIEEKTGIDLKRLQQWADVLDIYRIPNLTTREAELLQYANINSVQEMSHRQAIRIFYKLREIDEDSYYIILQLPTFAKIENWIYFAKIMTKRIKFGQNIPMILLPMIKIENASELKNFKIFTIEDFIRKSPIISHIRKRIHMSRKNYQNMLDMIKFIKIGAVDLYFAKLFVEAEIFTVEQFSSLSNEEIFSKVKTIQENDTHILEVITLEHISEIKANMKEEEK